MATAVEAAIEEVKAELLQMAPAHEGFRDLERLDISQATLTEVQLARTPYDRRKGLLDTALAALEALAADGHPELPVRDIPPEAFADIQAQQVTVTAALGQFKAVERAAALTFEAEVGEKGEV